MIFRHKQYSYSFGSYTKSSYPFYQRCFLIFVPIPGNNFLYFDYFCLDKFLFEWVECVILRVSISPGSYFFQKWRWILFVCNSHAYNTCTWMWRCGIMHNLTVRTPQRWTGSQHLLFQGQRTNGLVHGYLSLFFPISWPHQAVLLNTTLLQYNTSSLSLGQLPFIRFSSPLPIQLHPPWSFRHVSY